MTAKELLKQLENKKDFKIFDIRNIERYKKYHLPTAKNVPIGDLIANPEKYIKKDEEVYIICNSGNSSGVATNALTKLGYNAISVEGGMNPIIIELGD